MGFADKQSPEGFGGGEEGQPAAGPVVDLLGGGRQLRLMVMPAPSMPVHGVAT